MNINNISNYLDAKYGLLRYSAAKKKEPTPTPVKSQKEIDDLIAKRQDFLKRTMFQVEISIRNMYEQYIYPEGHRASPVILKLANEGDMLSKKCVDTISYLHHNFNSLEPKKIYTKLANLYAEIRKNIGASRDFILSGTNIQSNDRKLYLQNFERVMPTLSSMTYKAANELLRVLVDIDDSKKLEGEPEERNRMAISGIKLVAFLASPLSDELDIHDLNVLGELLKDDDMREDLTTLINAVARGRYSPKEKADLSRKVKEIKEKISIKKRNPTLEFKAPVPDMQDDDMEKMLARRKRIEQNQPERDRVFRIQQEIAKQFDEQDKEEKEQEQRILDKYRLSPGESRIPSSEASMEYLTRKYSNISFEQWSKRGSK
jgi:hypothetical protein